jgi:asparagine synthase (glutamine-hydrolysing)
MHGFVVWVDRVERGSIASFDLNTGSSECTIRGPWFGLFAQPYGGTPETEHEPQPLVTPDALLVYTGRVDNRGEIARRLAQPELARASDGVVLAAASAAWGDQFPDLVDGEFSFARLDRRTGRLLAGRDAIGLHKLLLYQDARRYWVASRLDLLLASLPQVPPDNRGAFAHFLGTGGGLGLLGETFYTGIDYLPAGHTVSHEGAGRDPQRRRYYVPDLERELLLPSPSDYVEQLRTLLFASVEGALRSSGPVCVELSGGLDSSTVTAVAARAKQRGAAPDLLAYSLIASETTQADERPFQAAVLERYPLEHYEFDIDTLGDVVDLRGVCQPAIVDAQGWVLGAQRALARTRGPRVCLTGHGGDFVFGHSMPPIHLAEALKRGNLSGWWREMNQWTRSGRYSLWRLLWKFSRGDSYWAFDELSSAPAWFAPSWARSIEEARLRAQTLPRGRFATNPREYHFSLVRRLAEIYPEAGRTPWESRAPLMARRLVEFMVRLPARYKATASDTRVLQRRALADVLPEKVARRRAKGDYTPRFFRGLRRRWDFWEVLARGKHLADLGVVDPARFHSSCLRALAGHGAELNFLVPALLLEAWLREPRVVLDGRRIDLLGDAPGRPGPATRAASPASDARWTSTETFARERCGRFTAATSCCIRSRSRRSNMRTGG